MRDEKLNFNNLLCHLGQTARRTIELANEPNIKGIKEIRLTAGKPLQIVYKDYIRFVGKNGKECSGFSESNSLTFDDIQESFAAVCEYSVHTYRNEICSGFITIEGGNRAGICGTAVYDENKIINVKDISAINIRVSHEVLGAADQIIKVLNREDPGGVLVVGPPCSGKTTILRDLSRQIGNGNLGKLFHVNIVDERMEIAGVYRGLPSFDIGSTTTVLNGYIKSDGIISAVRSMAPDFIVCDEFGGGEDISASLYAMKSGVFMIASMHAFDADELLQKQSFIKIINVGIFKWIVFMDKSCTVKKIVRAQELIK